MHAFTPEGLRTVRATFPGCIGGVRTADDADICRFSKNLQNGTGFVTNPMKSLSILRIAIIYRIYFNTDASGRALVQPQTSSNTKINYNDMG